MVEGAAQLSGVPTALFESPDATTFVPTGLARGPWDPRHCHGGPTAALLARAAEQVESDGIDWQLARLTIDLTRPVPVERPLTLVTLVERPGRKVSLISGVLSDDGTEVARFRALRVRSLALAVPEDANHDRSTLGPPEHAVRNQPARWDGYELLAYHLNAAELRFADGQWADSGPAEAWIRLTVPVIDGEKPTGAQRIAAAADFGNGISASIDVEKFTFINPDLTIHLARPHIGEWVGMQTTSYYGPDGAGLAESALYDTTGRVGRSCQSLLVQPR